MWDKSFAVLLSPGRHWWQVILRDSYHLLQQHPEKARTGSESDTDAQNHIFQRSPNKDISLGLWPSLISLGCCCFCDVFHKAWGWKPPPRAKACFFPCGDHLLTSKHLLSELHACLVYPFLSVLSTVLNSFYSICHLDRHSLGPGW